MFLAVARPGRVEIGHGRHVDPGIGNGDHHVRPAEAELAHHMGFGLQVARKVVQQVLARHAHMQPSTEQPFGDLARREKQNVRIRKTRDLGLVAALPADLAQLEAAVGMPGLGLVLQAALRGNGKCKPGHDCRASTAAARRSGRTTPPMAVMSTLPPLRSRIRPS